jgi:hypothetical protein
MVLGLTVGLALGCGEGAKSPDVKSGNRPPLKERPVDEAQDSKNKTKTDTGAAAD